MHPWLNFHKPRNAFPQPRPLPIVHRRQEASSISITSSSSGQVVQTVSTSSPSSLSSSPEVTSSSSSFTGPVGGESLVSQSTTTNTPFGSIETAVSSSIPFGGESMVSVTGSLAGTAAATPPAAAGPAVAMANPVWGLLIVGIAGYALAI